MHTGGDADAVADPLGVITRMVSEVEHHLDPERIHDVAASVVTTRAGRRRLAMALSRNPAVLRHGRPPAELAVARLLLALRRAGARDSPSPRCARCGKELRSLRSCPGGWACTPCLQLHENCAGCRQLRRVVSRDRHGKARCAQCPDTDGDPLGELERLVATLEPGLTGQAIQSAMNTATSRPAGQRRMAWVMIERPELLTGLGSQAPTPAVLRFIDALVAAGATTIVKPACCRCRQVKTLSKLLDGQRVCRNCFAKSAAVSCTRCGSVREPAARDEAGNPLCPNCLVGDAVNHEPCVICGRRKTVAVRLPDGPRCATCRPFQILACAICGCTTRCETSRATGQPWCLRCQQWWAECSQCGATEPVRGGSRAKPLCAKCLNPDPQFWGRCPSCQHTWQLSSRPCQRCVLNQQILQLLGDRCGQLRPDLEPLRRALNRVERPDTALTWLRRPKVRGLLTTISTDTRQLTHDLLDDLPADKTVAHLRSILVAAGALPARQERLLELERWIQVAIHTPDDLEQRQVLHSYAIWHHLRRLRRRLDGADATSLQALNVRCHVTAAVSFMKWLADQNITLACCTQSDLERWAAAPHSYRDETANFIRWALTHKHASGLSFGAIRWQGPAGPHDTEKRWNDARRLLHGHSIKTSDRVAGLLLLLYAQRIATISQLTCDHVRDYSDRVELTLGASPVILPPPVDQLVRDLIATHRGHAAIGRPDSTPWLFPGGRPGQHISHDRLGQRLKNIGLQPARARSTALFALATEVPAAILARMLGIHIQVATQWQQATSGDWAAYAADLSRRTPEKTY